MSDETGRDPETSNEDDTATPEEGDTEADETATE